MQLLIFPIQDPTAPELENPNPNPRAPASKAYALKSTKEAHSVEFAFHLFLLPLTYIGFLDNNFPDSLRKNFMYGHVLLN